MCSTPGNTRSVSAGAPLTSHNARARGERVNSVSDSSSLTAYCHPHHPRAHVEASSMARQSAESRNLNKRSALIAP